MLPVLVPLYMHSSHSLTKAQKFETSGHIRDKKRFTCFRCKGQFRTAATTAVKPAADSKQQLACPAGPNEH